jgi:hypothetical protein
MRSKFLRCSNEPILTLCQRYSLYKSHNEPLFKKKQEKKLKFIKKHFNSVLYIASKDPKCPLSILTNNV